MRIATWNVNSIKQRLEHLAEFLKTSEPDVVCLQELKCVDEAFPRLEIEALGYNVAVHGQKAYNGVAILSKRPLEDVRCGLPGDAGDDHARYIEAVISTAAACSACRRSICPTATRSRPLNSPTSSHGSTGSRFTPVNS